jgi:hypothetical protein
MKTTLKFAILPLVVALAAMGFAPISARASTVYAVAGITGPLGAPLADGNKPYVEGTLAVPSGLNLVATGVDVVLYYAGYAAADTDLLLIDGTPVFNNKTTPLGASYNLGIIAAGTVVTLELVNTLTHVDYFTGPASGNPDKAVHAAYAPWTALPGSIDVNGTFVGFEDLSFPGSDKDYNDLMIVAEGLVPTPEPSSLLLLGSGLLGLALVAFRKAKAARLGVHS